MENPLDKFCLRLAIVIGASFFNVEFGIADSYAVRLFTIDFYKEYLIVTLISLAVFELIYYIHKRLDKKFPLHDQAILRLFLQAVLGGLVPILLLCGSAVLCAHFFTIDIQSLNYHYVFHYVVVLLVLLNLILLMVPYCAIAFQYAKIKHLQQNFATSSIQSLKWIKVWQGKEIAMLEPTGIKAAYILNRTVFIIDIEGKELLTDLSLEELENNYLPSSDFYRINRQLIASQASVTEYRTVEHGKIEVVLSFPVPVATIVSQLKAKKFRKWIY